MKKYLGIIHKPKQVTVISIVVALLIGIIGYTIITKGPEYQYAKADAGEINVYGAEVGQNGGLQNITLSFLATGRINSVSTRVGDEVKKGQVLAMLDPENTLGSLTQAKAAYASALANYNKLVKGATNEDVAVTSAAYETAKTNLAHSKEVLVQAINNSFVTSVNTTNNINQFFDNPYGNFPQLILDGMIISDINLQNKIEIGRTPYNSMITSWEKSISGIGIESDLDNLATISQKNLNEVASYVDDLKILFIEKATANPGYEKTLETNRTVLISTRGTVTGQISSLISAIQSVSSAKTMLSQSQASLTLKTTSARSEDLEVAEAQVKSAYGAMQIAEATYNNRIITAPGDGTVTAVYITVGQTGTANAPAISISGKTFSKSVAIMIPNDSIIKKNGKSFVLVKIQKGTEEREVQTGSSDSSNTEILSGLSVGDEVVVR